VTSAYRRSPHHICRQRSPAHCTQDKRRGSAPYLNISISGVHHKLLLPSPSRQLPHHRRNKASRGPTTSPKTTRLSKPFRRAPVCWAFRSSPTMTSTAHGCCHTCQSCWSGCSPGRVALTWTGFVPCQSKGRSLSSICETRIHRGHVWSHLGNTSPR
jgi:hypothetical protein